MKKTILLTKPKEHQRDNLEFLLDSPAFKEKHNLTELSILVPDYFDVDLVIIGSDNLREDEKELLRTSYMLPMILISDSSQDELIDEYNVYRGINAIKPEIIPLIEEALNAKTFVDEALHRKPVTFFTGLEKLIKAQIIDTKLKEEKNIGGFEALYRLLKQEPDKVRERDPEDIVFETLHLHVVPPLELYEKTDDYKLVRIGERSFNAVVGYLNDIAGAASARFNFYVGGSTIAEQGIRCMVGINPRKKYDTLKSHGYFIRDVRSRKKVSNQFIAMLRYTVQKHFSLNPTKEVGKFSKMYHPLTYNNVSYLIQDALIGPDLEDVFLKLRDSISKADKKEREKLVATRDALMSKYLDDLVGWQRHTQKFLSEFPELSKQPTRVGARVAKYFKENMETIPCAFKEFVNFSTEETELWKYCLKDLSANALGLKKSRIVLSMDASTKNVKLHIGRCNPSLDQIIESICDENNNPDREKIDNVFYHVDTGYIPTHYLEDFFHIVDAYEPAEPNSNNNDVFEKTLSIYRNFCSKTNRKGDVDNIVSLCLAGTYRNTRRAYLVVNEFQSKNIAFARSGKHSRYKYERFRRLYQNMNEHHIKRSVMYMERLSEYFGELVKRAGVENNNDFYRQHKALILKIKNGIDAETAKEAMGFVASLQKAYKEEQNRKMKKYVSALTYSTTTYCMARLADKMQNVKLPVYESIMQGDKNE